MLSNMRQTWTIVCSSNWMPFWVIMFSTNTSRFFPFGMISMTPWLSWLCLLTHFLLYSIQALQQLDVEAILVLLRFNKYIIIILISLNIYFPTLYSIHQIHDFFFAFSMPIWLCPCITHSHIQPSYFIFIIVRTLSIIHVFDISTKFFLVL